MFVFTSASTTHIFVKKMDKVAQDVKQTLGETVGWRVGGGCVILIAILKCMVLNKRLPLHYWQEIWFM